MQRFYIKNFEKKEIFILENKEIFHQLVKVLRVREGEKIILFNGNDNLDLVYEIFKINKKNLELKFVEEIKKDSELNFELNLYQALPNKMEKIEYILQKGVEVGYKKFIFYRSERSQKIVISEKKLERLKKIIIEAVEQSSRSFVPELLIPHPSPLLIGEGIKGKNIFLHTQNDNSQNLSKFIEKCSSSPLGKGTRGIDLEGQERVPWGIIGEFNIFIGPEGGFSEKEIEYFEKNNFTRIHLGNRILRTETAGVVVGFTLGQMI